MRLKLKIAFYSVFLFSLLFSLVSITLATDSPSLGQGQDVYVPAYSHIYHGNKDTPLLLSVTQSIRNIEPNKPTNPPIIESVMIGTQSQLGISFTSRGQPLQ